MGKEGVIEIECPHCHNKVVPKKRFSRLTFTGLLIIGLIPFVLFLVLNVLYMLALPSLLRSMTAGLPSMLFNLEALITALFLIMIPTSIATLLLVLVIGIIPATIYLSVRRDTYKCPRCSMTL
ncbi:MAG: hypothetical protein QE164_07900 [Candidatus Nezhaarchaeota archaeon]|nr:hypothetical protein [Candidatus Nezhaarchaeota archaeon]